MNILVIYPNGNALNPHSGAETRIWNLNKVLIENGYNVIVFHSEKARHREDSDLKRKCNVFYNRELSFMGLSSFYLTDLNPFFLLDLLKIFKTYPIDIIQFEFPWGFLATKLLKKKRSVLIYDSQGVESEFIEIATKNPEFPRFFKPFAKIFGFLYEKLVCRLADIVVNVSNIDREYYVKKYHINREKTILIQTPSTLLPNKIKRTKNLRIEFRKELELPINKILILFHGGLPHPPNKEAFDLIEHYIAPQLQDEKNIFFVLAGHNVPKYKKGNIISLGFVDSLENLLYSVDFAIVPLVSGSGMRIKCTDYIITALPFVTTKNGIEGIDFVRPGRDYLLANNFKDDFIQKIKLLIYNEELRVKLHENLLKKSDSLDRSKFGKKFIKLYSKMEKKID